MRYSLLIFPFCLTFTVGAFAQKADKNKSAVKRIIITKAAPAPIGPYSQALAANGFLFVSGQIGSNPQTRQLLTGGIEAETTQVMENLKAILKEAGLDMQDVVKATIYLKDIAQFAKVNEIYGKYFITGPPARETVQVANLPANANIEISVVAVLK